MNPFFSWLQHHVRTTEPLSMMLLVLGSIINKKELQSMSNFAKTDTFFLLRDAGKVS